MKCTSAQKIHTQKKTDLSNNTVDSKYFFGKYILGNTPVINVNFEMF